MMRNSFRPYLETKHSQRTSVTMRAICCVLLVARLLSTCEHSRITIWNSPCWRWGHGLTPGSGNIARSELYTCIMDCTYYIISYINTGRIISGHNTARWRRCRAAAPPPPPLEGRIVDHTGPHDLLHYVLIRIILYYVLSDPGHGDLNPDVETTGQRGKPPLIAWSRRGWRK